MPLAQTKPNDRQFHLGDPTNQALCPATAFDDFNGSFCESWSPVNPHGGNCGGAKDCGSHLSLEYCRLACCGDPGCGGWLWSELGCYMGDDTAGCVPGPPPPGQPGGGTPNVGGRRAVPASPVLPPADGPQSVGFDASGWRNLSIPHDFVVEQAPTASGEANHGFRARNVSWYRRHVAIQEGERGGAVWLEFDGVCVSSLATRSSVWAGWQRSSRSHAARVAMYCVHVMPAMPCTHAMPCFF